MQTPDKSILLRCLSGEASPEEAAMLDDWLSASPAHRQEFESLWRLWQKTTDGAGYVRPDMERGWQDLQARVQPAPASVPVRTPVRPVIWKALSAVLAGGVITGMILVKTNRHAPTYPQVVRHSDQTSLKDTLPNGTILTLDEQGVFTYPSSGHGNQDTAVLITGKAYIQVPAGPLAIGVGGLSVHSKGGDFLLIHDSLTGTTDIEVSRGSLEVKSTTGSYIVEKGHSLLYDASAQRFTGKNSIDTNSVAFATGIFSFTNTPLKELTAVLAKAYKVGIRLDNPAIGDCRMTVQFDNMPIKSVLEIIAATLNIQYSIQQQGKMIYLNGRGCD